MESIICPTTLAAAFAITLLGTWFYYWKLCRRNLLKLAARIPGPEGLPIIGSALEFIGDSQAIFKNIYSKTFVYNKVIKLWIGPKLVIFLLDPRDVELILSSQVHIDKSSEYRFFKPWLGNGLLISTGDKWRAHRKLIAPTFHLNVLKSFISLFNANSREVVKKLQKEIGKDFDCHDYMSEATVEILLETAMGVSKKTQDQSGYDYAMAVMKMCDILHIRQTKLWLRPDLLFNLSKYGQSQTKLLDTIHSLTKKVIKNKKAYFASGNRGSAAVIHDELETNSGNFEKVDDQSSYTGLTDDLDVDDNVGEKKRMAFLDLMIESQESSQLTDEEIKEQVDTIMFEGHDTTAAASSFFLCMMGIYPEYQDKVVKELNDIFGDSDRFITFDDTLKMKYLERCLLETLRLFPPVPVIARQINENIRLGTYALRLVLLSIRESDRNLVLPAGATIIIGTYKIHRLGEFYPNPDKFDPDHFLPSACASRHYYSFIPFSAGPRSCVGRKYAMLKLKILLATILRNYKLKSEMSENDFQLQADIILKRAEGFKLKIEPRKVLM